MESVALIPARAGSKRLPQKNILPFRGKPMIYWSIYAAKKAECFDKIIVTTDSKEFAGIAEDAGADVLLRPENLGHDNVTLVPVMEHALDNINGMPEYFCMLMPNCPLRNAEDILRTKEQMYVHKAEASMSISTFGWTHPEWALSFENGRLRKIDENAQLQNYAKNDVLYAPSGAVRWANSRAFRQTKTFYPDKLSACIMPWHRAVDIDTQDDYDMALCVACALDNGFKFQENQ